MKQNIVIKVHMSCEKCRTKAMKVAATATGIDSVALQGTEKDQLVVTREHIDSAGLVTALRKKVGYATIISVEEIKEKKPDDEKGQGKKPDDKKNGGKKNGEKKNGGKKNGEKKNGGKKNGEKKNGGKKNGEKKNGKEKDEEKPNAVPLPPTYPYPPPTCYYVYQATAEPFPSCIIL